MTKKCRVARCRRLARASEQAAQVAQRVAHAPLQALAVDGSQPCGFSGRVEVPARLLEQGSPNTDVLILVTARPTAGSAIAFAGHCQEDSGSMSGGHYVPRRPTVGHLNINPASISLGEGGITSPSELSLQRCGEYCHLPEGCQSHHCQI